MGKGVRRWAKDGKTVQSGSDFSSLTFGVVHSWIPVLVVEVSRTTGTTPVTK